MGQQDRRALAEWLWGNQIYFYFRVLARDLASSLRVSPGSPPLIASQWPGEWMSGTPLYQALRREPDGQIALTLSVSGRPPVALFNMHGYVVVYTRV